MIKFIKIKNKEIGLGKPIFIIAEAGVNHNGSLKTAYELIDAAAAAGADAVKFQTFKAEQVTTSAGKMADYQKKNLGKTESQLKMLKKLELPEKFYKPLIKHCQKKKIIFLSTPHGGFVSVNLLNKLNVPAFKFGSGDLNNLPLLAYAAKFKKPIIISTGMSYLREVKQAVMTIKRVGNTKIVILHCTTDYPTALNDVNLLAMKTLAKAFNLSVGYSDHTRGIKVAVAATVLGARIIEKHFTLDRDLPGPDHKASLEPAELTAMVKQIRVIEKKMAQGESQEKFMKQLDVQEALGSAIKKPTAGELVTAKIARKSLVSIKDIKPRERFNEVNVGIKRPGTGLAPKYYFMILGKKARNSIKKDSLITSSDFI